MVGSKKPSRGEVIYIARVESYFEYRVNSVSYDVKNILARDEVDARL